ncbi:type IV-A pilus assembly ATPase PilB, partial [Acinetobacter baumannii]
TEAVVVEQDKLSKWVEATASAADSMSLNVGDADLDHLEVVEGGDDDNTPDIARSDADDAPIVRYLNKILVDAITQGASDIHFEPYEKFYRIRY